MIQCKISGKHGLTMQVRCHLWQQSIVCTPEMVGAPLMPLLLPQQVPLSCMLSLFFLLSVPHLDDKTILRV